MKTSKPSSAKLTIRSEDRLSSEMLGLELGVEVFDEQNRPVSAQHFKVHSEEEVFMEGVTNEHGEFFGQRVTNVREGVQKKIFLVLDDSPVSDWRLIGLEQHGVPFTIRTDVKVVDPSGGPIPELPLSIRIDDGQFIDGMTDDKGEMVSETHLVKTKNPNRELAVTLTLAKMLPKSENRDQLLAKFLGGERKVLRGEMLDLPKGRYRVKKDIIIEEGGAINLVPGTTLEFDQGAGILSQGAVMARGTKEEPIVLKPSGDLWGNITLLGVGARGSFFEFCVIEGAGGRNISVDQAVVRPLPYDRYGKTGKHSAGGALLLLSTDPEFCDVDPNKIVRLNNVIIRNGLAGLPGSVFCNRSSLRVSNSEIASEADHDKNSGWAIFSANSALLTVDNSKFRCRRAYKNEAVFFKSTRDGAKYVVEKLLVQAESDVLTEETALAERRQEEIRQRGEEESKENVIEPVMKVTAFTLGGAAGAMVVLALSPIIIPIGIIAGIVSAIKDDDK